MRIHVLQHSPKHTYKLAISQPRPGDDHESLYPGSVSRPGRVLFAWPCASPKQEFGDLLEHDTAALCQLRSSTPKYSVVIYKNDPLTYENNKVSMNPQKAILVHDEWYDYDPTTDGSMPVTSIEFYEVSEELPPLLKLDTDGSDLLQPPGRLNRKQQQNFDALQNQMNAVLESAPACPGDGNGDGVVNNKDISDFVQIRDHWGESSHYDFNFDALTNNDDLRIIRRNFGPCPKSAH